MTVDRNLNQRGAVHGRGARALVRSSMLFGALAASLLSQPVVRAQAAATPAAGAAPAPAAAAAPAG
ncbi:MAG TPA: hypothetical protein VIU64_23550, partial [Polyangia bacterium]